MPEKSFNLFQKREGKAPQVSETAKVTDSRNIIQEAPAATENADQYFSYITNHNTYHTAHVLNKIIKAKPENLKYACLVISYVTPELAQRLLGEFPEDVQVHVVSELLSLIQYSKSEIENFDKILRRLLTEQFGGKFVVTKLLEELDIERKMTLMNEFSKRYPSFAGLFRQIMILFEDILSVNDQNYQRIFSEIPNEILSMAFCNQSVEQQNRLYNILPKGLKNIVQQGIELGRKKYSRTEINKAQQYVIEYAKQLERDGFIDPIIKDEHTQTAL
jgi:flagellar motor switch protein FliG